MLTSILRNNVAKKSRRISAVIIFFCLAFTIASVYGPLGQAHAFTPNYNPNNLADNPTFLNNSAMSAGVIQVFLSNIGSGLAGYSDVESCDSTIAPYYDHCGQTISAAQIIYDASQAYSINPEVILATLEKEQSLVTDPTPTASQIDCAMGYHSCSGYVGFFTQVDNGAWALRYNYEGALRDATWLSWSPGSYYPCANATNLYSAGLYPGNSVTFANPGGASQTITIANAATASLYCYTPYVGPYKVTGYSGSYNFVYYFQLWFGSTQASVPYAWAYEGQFTYSDSGHSDPLTNIPTVAPGNTIYAQVYARNIGYETWTPAIIHLGTSNPDDRTSVFSDPSWLGQNTRPTSLLESSVAPGQTGIFDFALHAPPTTGTYNEYFNLLAEGITWMNDPGLFFTVNVVSPVNASNSTNTGLVSGASLNVGQYLLSPDTQTVLTLQPNSNLILYSNYLPSWSTGNTNDAANRLVMQVDGNLVLYNTSNQALWDSQTGGNPGAYLVLQTDGNMVIYSSTNQALWATYTLNNPAHLSFVVSSLLPNSRLYPGQELETANRQYKLILQPDGNLVLYSTTRALWSTETNDDSVSFLAMQPDGNLVLYSNNYQPLWNSHTASYGLSSLIMQPDGNLVLYGPRGATWDSGTTGQQ